VKQNTKNPSIEPDP